MTTEETSQLAIAEADLLDFAAKAQQGTGSLKDFSQLKDAISTIRRICQRVTEDTDLMKTLSYRAISQTLDRMLGLIQKCTTNGYGLYPSSLEDECQNAISCIHEYKYRLAIALEWEELYDQVLFDIDSELTLINDSLRPGSESGLLSSPTDLATNENATKRKYSLNEIKLLLSPLKASLDLFPIRLTSYQHRADLIYPSSTILLRERWDNAKRQWQLHKAKIDELERQDEGTHWRKTLSCYFDKASRSMDELDSIVTLLQDEQHSTTTIAEKLEYKHCKDQITQSVLQILAIIDKHFDDKPQSEYDSNIIESLEMLQNRWTALTSCIELIDTKLCEISLKSSLESTENKGFLPSPVSDTTSSSEDVCCRKKRQSVRSRSSSCSSRAAGLIIDFNIVPTAVKNRKLQAPPPQSVEEHTIKSRTILTELQEISTMSAANVNGAINKQKVDQMNDLKGLAIDGIENRDSQSRKEELTLINHIPKPNVGGMTTRRRSSMLPTPNRRIPVKKANPTLRTKISMDQMDLCSRLATPKSIRKEASQPMSQIKNPRSLQKPSRLVTNTITPSTPHRPGKLPPLATSLNKGVKRQSLIPITPSRKLAESQGANSTSGRRTSASIDGCLISPTKIPVLTRDSYNICSTPIAEATTTAGRTRSISPIKQSVNIARVPGQAIRPKSNTDRRGSLLPRAVNSPTRNR